jgi:hypothetical protein
MHRTVWIIARALKITALSAAIAVISIISAWLLLQYAFTTGKKAAKPLAMLRACNNTIKRLVRRY